MCVPVSKGQKYLLLFIQAKYMEDMQNSQA